MFAVRPEWLLALQAGTAIASIWGVLRLTRLRAVSDDPRLARLAWFFALFAAAMAANALVTMLHVGSPPPAPPAAAPVGAGPAGPPAGGAPPPWLDWTRHGLEVVALLAGVLAYSAPRRGHPDRPGSSAPALMLFGPLGAMGFVEAALALYLALRVGIHGVRRATRRSYVVVAGFLLLFLNHASSWVLEPVGGPPPVVAPLFALAGTLLLAGSVPRRT